MSISMNIKFALTILLSGLALASCSDSTDEIGSSLNSQTDAVNVETASYDVSSESVLADSVLSRNTGSSSHKKESVSTFICLAGAMMSLIPAHPASAPDSPQP